MDARPVQIAEQIPLDELRLKQRAFVRYYVHGGPDIEPGNGTAAYLKAYGCKRTTAEAGAVRLLRNHKVSKAIRHLERQRDQAAQQETVEWAAHGDEMRRCLLDIARNGKSEGARLRAIALWLAYAEGRPMQSVNATVGPGTVEPGQIQETVRRLQEWAMTYRQQAASKN